MGALEQISLFLDIDLSEHVYNKRKKYLGGGPAQGLDNTILTAEANYPNSNYTIMKDILY